MKSKSRKAECSLSQSVGERDNIITENQNKRKLTSIASVAVLNYKVHVQSVFNGSQLASYHFSFVFISLGNWKNNIEH